VGPPRGNPHLRLMEPRDREYSFPFFMPLGFSDVAPRLLPCERRRRRLVSGSISFSLVVLWILCDPRDFSVSPRLPPPFPNGPSPPLAQSHPLIRSRVPSPRPPLAPHQRFCGPTKSQLFSSAQRVGSNPHVPRPFENFPLFRAGPLPCKIQVHYFFSKKL